MANLRDQAIVTLFVDSEDTVAAEVLAATGIEGAICVASKFTDGAGLKNLDAVALLAAIDGVVAAVLRAICVVECASVGTAHHALVTLQRNVADVTLFALVEGAIATVERNVVVCFFHTATRKDQHTGQHSTYAHYAHIQIHQDGSCFHIPL